MLESSELKSTGRETPRRASDLKSGYESVGSAFLGSLMRNVPVERREVLSHRSSDALVRDSKFLSRTRSGTDNDPALQKRALVLVSGTRC